VPNGIAFTVEGVLVNTGLGVVVLVLGAVVGAAVAGAAVVGAAVVGAAVVGAAVVGAAVVGAAVAVPLNGMTTIPLIEGFSFFRFRVHVITPLVAATLLKV
jgi:hypothetical protein